MIRPEFPLIPYKCLGCRSIINNASFYGCGASKCRKSSPTQTPAPPAKKVE